MLRSFLYNSSIISILYTLFFDIFSVPPTVKQPLSVSLYRGVHIQSKIHPCLTVKGYCFMSCKTIYVMISSFLSEEEKMIVAAHELGHIILHRSQLKMAPMQDDTLYNMTDNTEYQANH